MRILPLFLSCALVVSGASLMRAADAPTPAIEAQPTTLTCDHMDMWSEGDEAKGTKETKAICTGNVTVRGTNIEIICDRLELTATNIGEDSGAIPTLEKFKYLLATGNVSIKQGSRIATCGRAEVLPREEKVVLTEKPVVVDEATGFVSAGERITMLRGQERVEVEKPVLTGPPIKDLGFKKEEPAEAAPEAPAPR